MLELKIIPLPTHHDGRGNLTEIFRREWIPDSPPVQWNFVRSEGNVLRGVHVHVSHVDYVVALQGRMLVGVRDLRQGEAGAIVELYAAAPAMLTIPPGVAHGFYFPEPGAFIYGMTHYWDPVNDELDCRWDDAGLAIPWPDGCASPRLSPRDQGAGSLEQLRATLRAHGHTAW